MGFKHLLGYSLVISGIALIPLLFAFFLNKQVFDTVFLITLACLAIFLCAAGGVVLKRLS